MLTDPRGLALSIASGDAVAHYDEAVENCFQYRLKTGKCVKRALEAGGSSSLLSDRTRAKPNSAGTWAKYASVLDALGSAGAAPSGR